MDELTIEDKKYLSSKRAAKVTGYAKDYVGQLCREGRVEARLVGRNWYVLESSILEHRFGAETKDESGNQGETASKQEVAATWEPPKYSPEPITPILAVEKSKENASGSIQEMQTAWKEWFETRKTANQTEQTIVSEPEVAEEAQSEPEGAFEGSEETASTEEELPVHLSKVREERLEEVHQGHSSHGGEMDIVRARPLPPTEYEETEVFEEPAREKRGVGRVVLQATLLAVALLAAATAIVSTGIREVGTTEESRLLQFLNGTSEYRSNK